MGQFMESLNLRISSLVGYAKRANAFLVYIINYALMKLFTIDGVYIKVFGELIVD